MLKKYADEQCWPCGGHDDSGSKPILSMLVNTLKSFVKGKGGRMEKGREKEGKRISGQWMVRAYEKGLQSHGCRDECTPIPERKRRTIGIWVPVKE